MGQKFLSPWRKFNSFLGTFLHYRSQLWLNMGTWGVTAIYAKILHDPVLQESQKKFWLFNHNFRALDLTWSEYVIVTKSTWVWELHNCQLTLITNLIKLSWKSWKRQYFCTCMALFTCFFFLLWMKSTKCRNIADCNIFALLWITALS